MADIRCGELFWPYSPFQIILCLLIAGFCLFCGCSLTYRTRGLLWGALALCLIFAGLSFFLLTLIACNENGQEADGDECPLAGNDQLQGNVERRVLGNLEIADFPIGGWGHTDIDPWALIFPHHVELASHDDELIDGGGSKYPRENNKAPIREAAFLFYPISKFLPPWLLVICSLICSVSAVLCLTFGCYFFCVHESSFIGFLLCALFGALLFALAFSFAHASLRIVEAAA